ECLPYGISHGLYIFFFIVARHYNTDCFHHTVSPNLSSPLPSPDPEVSLSLNTLLLQFCQVTPVYVCSVFPDRCVHAAPSSSSARSGPGRLWPTLSGASSPPFLFRRKISETEDSLFLRNNSHWKRCRYRSAPYQKPGQRPHRRRRRGSRCRLPHR